MRNIVIITILAAAVQFSVPLRSALGMEWKVLHERAATMSVADARAAAEKDGHSVDAVYTWGIVCIAHWEDAEAGKAFADLRVLDPLSVYAQWGIAEVQRRQHKLVESAKELDAVIAKAPGFFPAYLSRAYIDYLDRDFNRAALRASIVMKQDKGAVDLDTRARAYSLYAGSKGMIAHFGGPVSKIVNGAAVLSYLKKAEQLKYNDPTVLFGLGSFYLLSPAINGGDVDRAIEYLEKAAQQGPRFADILVRLSQAYKVKGNAVKAKAYLDQALAIDPGNEFANDVVSGRCRYICP